MFDGKLLSLSANTFIKPDLNCCDNIHCGLLLGIVFFNKIIFSIWHNCEITSELSLGEN